MKHADYVVEYAKTFINLASLLLGLSITFAGKVSGGDEYLTLMLLATWLLWISSVYYGSQAIREMVNVAYRSETPEEDVADADASVDLGDTVFSPVITRALNLQFWLFSLGFAAAVVGAARLAWMGIK